MGKVIELARDKQHRWVDVGALEDVPKLGARVLRGPGGDVAVFRTRDDAVFALDDHCPHRGGPLSQGIVTGCRVICPLHDWCISLEDGKAEAPDEGLTGTYPARVSGGRIFIGFSRS